MKFPKLSIETYTRRFAPPEASVSIIFDSDTYNEVDDQFALTYALLSRDQMKLKGITAAPFFNDRSDSPEDGMEKSYLEILKILKMLGCDDECPVLRGAKEFMVSRDESILSPAAEFIVEQALAHGERGEILYIVAIAAITNVASAILMNPDIIQYITVIWLGGHPYYWNMYNEFNLRQDIHAAQVLFDSGVPLIHVPCRNVAEQVRSCPAELALYVKGRGEIGDYLYQSFCDFREDTFAMTKEIWDLAALAWLTCRDGITFEVMPAPKINDDRSWDLSDSSRHPVCVISTIRRDSIFRDFFIRLDAFSVQLAGEISSDRNGEKK